MAYLRWSPKAVGSHLQLGLEQTPYTKLRSRYPHGLDPEPELSILYLRIHYFVWQRMRCHDFSDL